MTFERSRRDSIRLVVLLAFVGLLYWVFPATVFRGDGLAYGYNLEHPGPELVNPNHLLYGVVGWTTLEAVRIVVRDPDPIRVLQQLGVLTAVTCLALFYSLMLSLGIDPRSCRVFTLLLSVTSGFWLQAISPDIYLLSMTLALLVFRVAVFYLDGPTAGRCLLLGGVCGIAVLGTEVDLLLFPCAAWIIARSSSPTRLRDLVLAGTSLLLVTGSGLALGAVYAGVAFRDIVPWLLGRATVSSWFEFSPLHLLRNVRNLLVNLLPKLSILLETLKGRLSWTGLGYSSLALGALSILAYLTVRAVRGVPAVVGRDRTLFVAIGGYLLGLTAFFTIWANHLSEFWATHWIAIWLLLAIALRPCMSTHDPVLLRSRVLAVVLGLTGFVFLALPLWDSDEGALNAELRRRIGPQDQVVVTWHEELPSLPRPGLLERQGSDASRRSTFAVCLETYIRRPVLHLGCWVQNGEVSCYESASEKELFRSIREALREGNRAWLLRLSDLQPRRGLSRPDITDRLPRVFRAEPVTDFRVRGVFHHATLHELCSRERKRPSIAGFRKIPAITNSLAAPVLSP